MGCDTVQSIGQIVLAQPSRNLGVMMMMRRLMTTMRSIVATSPARTTTNPMSKEATTKTAGFLKAPLKLGGIVQAISSLAKSIEEEEAA